MCSTPRAKCCGRRASSRRACGAADALWRLAEAAQEGAAHALGIAEADLARDDFERLGAGLDAQPRRLGPEALDRLGRGLAGLGEKGAAELARAETGDLGETLDRELLVEMLAGEGERRPDTVGFRIEIEHGRELRLSARAAVIDDEVARSGACDLDPAILLDEGEREVDPGADPGRAPDRAVPREDAVAGDLDPGIKALQRSDMAPMRGGDAPVEEAGFGEDEGAGADAGDTARPRGAALTTEASAVVASVRAPMPPTTTSVSNASSPIGRVITARPDELATSPPWSDTTASR
jgi:hypothetical protein